MDHKKLQAETNREHDLWLILIGASFASKSHLEKLKTLPVSACIGRLNGLVSAIHSGDKNRVMKAMESYGLGDSETLIDSVLERLSSIDRMRRIRNAAEQITLAAAANDTELVDAAAAKIAAIVTP